ncbi:hypothetical protein B0H14DRAFT_2602884 [Mycena olivaceomarginata]|nr:hypothetical protein B0H14DRAFT_2602884 [Mycena olivaceomarginata]
MALMLWRTFTAVKCDLDAIRDYIATKQREVGAFNPESDPKVSSMYHTLERKILKLKSDAAQNLTTKQTVEELVALMPFRILFEYLSNSASLAIAPYRWKETRAAKSVDASVCSPVVQQELEDCLGTMINPQLMNHTVLDSDEIPWIESAISQLLSLWHSENAEHILRPIITILEKWPKKTVARWLGGGPDVREEDCTTFWHLASAGFTVDRDDTKESRYSRKSLTPEQTQLEKTYYLRLTIPDSLMTLRCSFHMIYHRVRETRIAILAELLEHCTSDVLPYHTAVEVISQWIPRSAIHPIHQVTDKIIAGDCWGLYAKGAQNEEGVKTHREELERSPGGWG